MVHSLQRRLFSSNAPASWYEENRSLTGTVFNTLYSKNIVKNELILQKIRKNLFRNYYGVSLAVDGGVKEQVFYQDKYYYNYHSHSFTIEIFLYRHLKIFQCWSNNNEDINASILFSGIVCREEDLSERTSDPIQRIVVSYHTFSRLYFLRSIFDCRRIRCLC
jgi:hypothetical protein